MNARALATRVSRSEPWRIGLVCVALRAVSLVRLCLSDDEAIYAVVAREMLAGRVLYRDVVDHKPPLIYFVYALTQAVGGPRGGMVLLHLLTIAVVLATALLLRRIVRELSPGPSPDSLSPARADWAARASTWAALLYVVFSTTLLPFDGLAANCELFMMLPLTASVWFFLRGNPGLHRGALFLSGVLVGVAALCKYQAGVQLALYGAAVIVTHRRRLPRALLAGATVLAGTVAVVVGTLALLHSLGWLDGPAAWFWFRFNFSYIKTGFAPLDTAKRAVVRISFVAGAAAFLWTLGIAGALKSIGRGPNLTFARFAGLWAVASALAITTGGRFFGHYFHQITAPLAVLAAPAADQLWRSRRPSTRPLVMAAVGGPAVAFFLLGVFQAPVLAAAGQPAPDYRTMADLVGTHTRPAPRDNGLVVWGNLPVLYFLAERPLGTRFVFSNYMTGLSPATPSQSDPAVDASANVVPESWAMFEADVAARKPHVLVDTSAGNVAAYGKFPPSTFPRLKAILDRDYQAVAQAAGVRVFVRREGAN